jgi:hypothetical protein
MPDPNPQGARRMPSILRWFRWAPGSPRLAACHPLGCRRDRRSAQRVGARRRGRVNINHNIRRPIQRATALLGEGSDPSPGPPRLKSAGGGPPSPLGRGLVSQFASPCPARDMGHAQPHRRGLKTNAVKGPLPRGRGWRA